MNSANATALELDEKRFRANRHPANPGKAGGGQVTLLYSAKDTEHNQAVVLSAYLNEKASRSELAAPPNQPPGRPPSPARAQPARLAFFTFLV